MQLLGLITTLFQCARLVLLRPPHLGFPRPDELRSTAGAVVTGVRLHPLDGGAAYGIHLVPWPSIVAGTREWTAIYALLCVPPNVALVAFALRLRGGARPPIFSERTVLALMFFELLSYPAVELQVWRYTGALLVWPFDAIRLLHAANVLLLFRRAPYSSAAARCYLAARFAAFLLPMLLLRPQLLLRREGLWLLLNAAVTGFSVSRAGARDRALRSLFERERAVGKKD